MIQQGGQGPSLCLILSCILCYVCYCLFLSSDIPKASSSFKFLSLSEFEKRLRTAQHEFPGSENYTVGTPLCPALQPEVRKGSLSGFWNDKAFWGVEEVELEEIEGVGLGGTWFPQHCIPVHHVAIIVPFRERVGQLWKFLAYMHRFLRAQMVRYRVFLIEQMDDKPFNRGKLFNVGFHIGSALDSTLGCVIFHDVDIFPENLWNMYACTKDPRHLSAVTNSFRYTLLYPELFGGVVGFPKEVFIKVNGFSNEFYGWGGEDDDMFLRLKAKNISVIRLSPSISSYRMLPHKKEMRSSSERIKMLEAGMTRPDQDGLSNLKFETVNHIVERYYTLIQVKL